MTDRDTVWSVSDVNGAMKELVENSFSPFWLRGEVSDLKIYDSGHVFFQLKDERSQIGAVYFGGAGAVRDLRLKNGDRIETYGRLDVHIVRGLYRFYIRTIRPAGLGEMQRRFEELKGKLKREGLFDEARKRPIPALPRAVGVITSPTGAAIRDFLKIVDQRFSDLSIMIYPAQVQGASSAAQLASGVSFFNRVGGVDVLVITRGGGSAEDLWSFNDEALARAVASSRIPVISAVGHEIDFTICDFVADARAATPTAAAEMVIGRREEMVETLSRLGRGMLGAVKMQLYKVSAALADLAGKKCFQEPQHQLRMRGTDLDKLQSRMATEAKRSLKDGDHVLKELEGRLRILDPRRQLERGYAILTDANGHPVVSARGQKSGAELTARLADGSLELTVR